MSVPTRDGATLLEEIRALLQAARADAARQVNAPLVLTRFEVGHRIVHHEQGGDERAGYGEGVLEASSRDGKRALDGRPVPADTSNPATSRAA